MSKKRYIDTRFWNDNFIVELDPIERYLFLYLLTNEHTNISGVYELPRRVMAFETGLDKEMLDKMLSRFEPKVLYVDGWICLTNFLKHQSTSSIKIRTGIEENIKDVPQKIIDKMVEYGYPIDRVSRAIIYSNRDSNSNTNKNRDTSSFKKKPYFRGEEMRKKGGRWFVIPKEGGAWLEFAGKESEIEWK